MEDVLREILYELKEIKKGIRAIDKNSNPVETRLLIDGEEIGKSVVKYINEKSKISSDVRIMV